MAVKYERRQAYKKATKITKQYARARTDVGFVVLGLLAGTVFFVWRLLVVLGRKEKRKKRVTRKRRERTKWLCKAFAGIK